MPANNGARGERKERSERKEGTRKREAGGRAPQHKIKTTQPPPPPLPPPTPPPPPPHVRIRDFNPRTSLPQTFLICSMSSARFMSSRDRPGEFRPREEELWRTRHAEIRNARNIKPLPYSHPEKASAPSHVSHDEAPRGGSSTGTVERAEEGSENQDTVLHGIRSLGNTNFIG